MVLYHGSKNLFEKFSYDKIGNNAGCDEGYGFYFTSSKDIATQYADGGYLYTVKIPQCKSLSDSKITITTLQLKKLLKEIHYNNDILNDFNDVDYYGINTVLHEAIEMLMQGNSNDVDLIAEVCNICGDKETVLKTLYSITGIAKINSIDNKFTKNGSIEKLVIMLDSELIEVIDIKKL